MRKPKKVTSILVLLLTVTIFALVQINESQTVANAQSSIHIQILSSVGGTTDPGPGNYTFTEGGDRAILTATADPEWQFAYWLFVGPYLSGHTPGVMESNQIYANPADVTHNYDYAGYTYTYQAVFVPSSIASRPLGFPTEYFLPLAIIIVVIAGITGFIGYTLGKRQRK